MVLMAALALGVAGCETTKDERSAGRRVDDDKITTLIRDSLDEEPVYKFNNVAVKAFAGDVQLSGFVNTDTQKERAGEIAERTPGVVQVHNNLVLKPIAPTPTGRTNVPDSRIYTTPGIQTNQPPDNR